MLPWFADTAWLAPYPWLLRHLVPVAPLVVTVGAVFEAAVVTLLLTRRQVPLALGLAAAWMLGLIPAVGWPYWLTNLALGLAVGLLAFRAARQHRREGTQKA